MVSPISVKALDAMEGLLLKAELKCFGGNGKVFLIPSKLAWLILIDNSNTSRKIFPYI